MRLSKCHLNRKRGKCGYIDTINTDWDAEVSNWADKYCGNCFRTQSEAEKHKYEVYERLTGKKWEEK